MSRREKLVEALKTAEVNEKDKTVRMSVQFRDMIMEELKEPEESRPEIEGGSVSWWYVCGECHGTVRSQDKYCRHCGRRFVWDEMQMQRMRTEDS